MCSLPTISMTFRMNSCILPLCNISLGVSINPLSGYRISGRLAHWPVAAGGKLFFRLVLPHCLLEWPLRKPGVNMSTPLGHNEPRVNIYPVTYMCAHNIIPEYQRYHIMLNLQAFAQENSPRNTFTIPQNTYLWYCIWTSCNIFAGTTSNPIIFLVHFIWLRRIPFFQLIAYSGTISQILDMNLHYVIYKTQPL